MKLVDKLRSFWCPNPQKGTTWIDKMKTVRNAERMPRLKGVIIVIAFLIAVAVIAFVILTGGFLSTGYTSAGPRPAPYMPPSTMEVVSAYACQDPNNPSQVSALALVIQPNGTASTDFTQGKVTIALFTSQAQYENVYNVSNFINSSTFNNTYGGSLTHYLDAPNCSIKEFFSSTVNNTYSANFGNYLTSAPNCSIIELNGNGSQILQPGETFSIFLNLNSTCLNCPLSAYQQFTVMLTPAAGATLIFTGVIPADIIPVMDLTEPN